MASRKRGDEAELRSAIAEDDSAYVKKLNLYRIKAYVPFEFVGIGASEENAKDIAMLFVPEAAHAAASSLYTTNGELNVKAARIVSAEKINSEKDLPPNWDGEDQPYGDTNWELRPVIGDWFEA